MEEDQCTAAVLEVEEDKVELEVELDILQFVAQDILHFAGQDILQIVAQDILQTELSLLWLKID